MEMLGRIVVYSISGCPHCRRAKHLLHSIGLPFVEINLDLYPERRGEMLRLCGGERTVPQIFFNEVHIQGGNAKLQKLHEAGKLSAIIKHVMSTPPPPDAPQPPNPSETVGARLQAQQPQQQDSFSDFGGGGGGAGGGVGPDGVDIHAALAAEIRAKLVGTKMHMFKPWEKVFIGKDAVKWMVKQGHAATKEEAIGLGNAMLHKHYFHHVYYDHDFKNERLFYRFIADEEKDILNPAKETMSSSLPATVQAEQLRRMIMSIYDDFLSLDGLKVDYGGISRSALFANYCHQVRELAYADLSSLRHRDTLAFFINVYNAMVIHATVLVGNPRNMFQRQRFFNKPAYMIGGSTYTLNEIESGILRGNRKAVGAMSVPFTSPTDPRRRLALAELDPRIHFALVCGAKSCPPIKTYRSETIHEDLTAATQAFFDSGGCIVDEQARTVSLSKLLRWYQTDFGPSEESMLTWVASYLDAKARDALLRMIQGGSSSFSVSYQEYDWSQNTV